MNIIRSMWKKGYLVIGALVMASLALSGCGLFAEPLERSSEHFQFVATSATSTEAEMQAGIERAEAVYAAVAAIIPPDFPLTPVLDVQLNGDLRSQSPYVDGDGTIQLYRYSAEEGGYWALLAHEIVHAITFDHGVEIGALDWAALGFYNEAWAEHVAQIVDPEKSGFPLYGFDEEVVVGHWVSQGGLSLAALRASHETLNARCEHQAYPMRASWFRYVDETYGRQAALDVFYGGREMTPAVVEEVLGQSLTAVDEAWRDWALARYAEHPAADAQARAYRARIANYEPCVE